MADRDGSERVLSAAMAGKIGASLKTGVMPPDRKRALRERLMENLRNADDPLCIVRADEGEWVETAPGIQIKLLYREPSGPCTTSLWRLQPGASVGPHAHDHDEECLVLEGEILVGGVSLKAGDFLLGQVGVDHPEVTSPNGALLLIRSSEPPPALAPHHP